ncbi:hypothetical protein BKG82_26280 [Mycobacteroides chelonae]|uniref:Replication protein n=1 Tax=Mycobacteroides chelonae TaxID=1774 RepID=A0A1S1LHI8_MYCCH|nr:hypothetical protein BKG82_26280 [Mycobacteroides chelonae]
MRRGSLTDWIRDHAPVAASVPVVSRARWNNAIADWAASEPGQGALARHHIRIVRFLAVAAAMARHCDGSTGRNIAVGNKLLAHEAGCSERLVSTVRRILLEAGWLHKSAEGVSSRTGRFNRPPIVHLTTPRPVVRPQAATPKARRRVVKPVDNVGAQGHSGVRVCDLLRSTAVGHISQVPLVVGKPKARTRALRNTGAIKSTAERARWTVAYRLADELISRTTGLQGARGPVAAALRFSHLDLPAWTALKLKAALDAWAVTHRDSSGVVRGMDWPAVIERPGAFMAYRLSHLNVAPPADEPRYVRAAAAPVTGAGRTRAWAAITEHLAGLRRTRGDRLAGRDECPLCSGSSLNADLCQHCTPAADSDMPNTSTCAAHRT